MPGYRRGITPIIKHYGPIGSGTIKMIMAEDLYNPQVLAFAHTSQRDKQNSKWRRRL